MRTEITLASTDFSEIRNQQDSSAKDSHGLSFPPMIEAAARKSNSSLCCAANQSPFMPIEQAQVQGHL